MEKNNLGFSQILEIAAHFHGGNAFIIQKPGGEVAPNPVGTGKDLANHLHKRGVPLMEILRAAGCLPDPLGFTPLPFKQPQRSDALIRFLEWSREVDMRLFGYETAFTNINPLNL